jgi:hypothetical protein
MFCGVYTPSSAKALTVFLAVRFDPEVLPTFNRDGRPAYAEEMIMSVCSSLIAIVGWYNFPTF